MTAGKVLVVYMEPTSYTAPLVDRLRERWGGTLDVLYIGANLSQAWGDEWDGAEPALLPASRLRAIAQVARLIAKGHYNVVHLAGWGHPVLWGTLLAARYHRVPTVVESDTPTPSHTAAWKRLAKALLYPTLFRMPAAFLPGGSRQAAYLRKFRVADSRITVARMTVDTARIAFERGAIGPAQREGERAGLGIPEDATVFLYVGRLEEHKGLRILLEAFDRLSGATQLPAKLVVVGDGSLRDVVFGAAGRNGDVIALGRLAGDRLLRAYALADVFVLPSWFEPWGLVVNEAMACGLPVIATEAVGCVDDLVIEGQTGRVVAPGDVGQLAEAMADLRSHPHERDRLARGCRDLIASWTIEAEAEVVVGAWKEVMKSEDGARL